MKQGEFGLIVQARTGSSRLPKKLVLPVFGEKTFLHVLLERLSRISDQFKIIIATSVSNGDDEIESIAKSLGFPVFRGSENNVLDRFVSCAEVFNIDRIVRVCADNPFIDLQTIKNLVEQYTDEDYLSYSIDGRPSILTHYGFFAEVVSLQALKKVWFSGELNCVEHVTNCIYTNRSRFNVRLIPTTVSEKNVRCTLDTQTDFQVLKQIYSDWYLNESREHSGFQSLVKYIEAQPQLLSLMESQIKQNSK